MSKDNFDDAIHIVKKINFFLAMCLQDVDHLNYDEEPRQVLKYLLNQHGTIFLSHLVDSAVLVEKISKINQTKDTLELSDEGAKYIQDEWNKVFNGQTKRPKLEVRNIFSEGQTRKEDAQKGPRDPRNPEIQEGSKGTQP